MTSKNKDWDSVPDLFRTFGAALPVPWAAIFEPLRGADGTVVVGQLGQSLDGRVATVTGHSHYINGNDGLDHLHRLRSLVDAVVVGVGTALADDPQLTVRRVAGPSPARVVLDPRRRLPAGAKLFADDGIQRLVVAAPGGVAPAGCELVEMPLVDGAFAPADIVATLAARGYRRILVEGGAKTVSAFMAAGCLNRLHVVVAPVILGSGMAGLDLPSIDTLDQAWRMPVHTHFLGREVLFDCDLSAQRGTATKST